MNMLTVVQSLSESRPIFHSEADFQFALAWEIKNVYPEARIRLEVPCEAINGNMDIIVFHDNTFYPIELKYKKIEFLINIDGEQYNLTSDLAKTQTTPAFIKDIYRVEKQSEILNNGVRAGFAIWLTNDHTYWKEPRNLNVKYSPFFVHDGARIAGRMENSRHSINILGQYIVQWMNYHEFNGKNGVFKYALFDLNN